MHAVPWVDYSTVTINRHHYHCYGGAYLTPLEPQSRFGDKLLEI